MECTVPGCGAAHDSEYVTVDVVDQNDMVRTQSSIGPFCRRCSGGISRAMHAHLNNAIDAQFKANSIELQRQRTQERGDRLHEASAPKTDSLSSQRGQTTPRRPSIHSNPARTTPFDLTQ